MLGLEGVTLHHDTVEAAAVADDGEGARLKVRFPSMSKLVRECGDGCRWGYVLR